MNAMYLSEHGTMLLFHVIQCLDFESLQHRTMQSSSYFLLIPEVQTKAAAPLPEGRVKATKGCYEESPLLKTN